MGLDMYLSCNSKRLTQEVFDAEVAAGLEPADSFHKAHGIICYWRKANAIHRWFVEHVQDGRDDCGLYGVTADQLGELLDTCRKVRESCDLVPGTVSAGLAFTPESGLVRQKADGLVIADASRAVELLPTQEGFFFGSTDYDEGYVADLDRTILVLGETLSRLVEESEFPWTTHHASEPDWDVRFTYQSSW